MQLYNSIARKKQDFEPLRDNTVRMYVCGITAYDYCHIGHARSAVVFDVLYRYLKYLGYEVIFVRNFTDVDDKIINRAKQENSAEVEIAERFIRAFYKDMDSLGIARPQVEPRATEHIPEMIEVVKRLIERGHAYVTSGNDVYFRVRSYEGYGGLSGRNIEELQSGARIQPGEGKEDPLDFALWKSAKPGEPIWDSPWGPGRPGWHLECSAMSEKYLGLPMDIHGGGQDLAFPHHENERAQSEAAFGCEFVRFWVHNGFVQVNSEKMSKSLGNFITIRNILTHYLPEVLRFFLLTKHYRSPLDYSDSALDEAEKALRRLYQAMQGTGQALQGQKWVDRDFPQDLRNEFSQAGSSWRVSMDDDLNTAGALGHMFTMARIINRILEDKKLRTSHTGREIMEEFTESFRNWSRVLGVLGRGPGEFLHSLRACRAARAGIDPQHVENLLNIRQQARVKKDFAQADAVRDELAALGVEVRDTLQGADWDMA